MSNKLKDILEEFDSTLGDSAMEVAAKNWELNDKIRLFIQDKLVEYARSVVPTRQDIKAEDYEKFTDYERGRSTGNNQMIKIINKRIDQDLHSLTK